VEARDSNNSYILSFAVSSASNAEALSLSIFACALLSKDTVFVFFAFFLLLRSPPPTSANFRNVRDLSGNFSRLLEKKTTTKKIGFYFFTYEWSRRRFSLIKMINGVEEVLILLFAAFRYEYLF